MKLTGWKGRFVFALIAIAGLGLTIHSCRFDWRCLTDTYPAHCDGPVAVQCEGGRGSLPLVRRDDCREAAEGPGTCLVWSPKGGGPTYARCRTLCDPSTFVAKCNEVAWAFNCLRHHPNEPFEVSTQSCTAAIGCEVRVARDGRREAICRGDQDYSTAGSEEAHDTTMSRGVGGRQ
jgi:hypothetical protein